MNNESKSNYLDILQIFRGIAALMIVFHHTWSSIKFYHKIEFPLFNFLALLGKFGVDFFFVLSGFIISYTSIYKYDKPNSILYYLKNRLIRIYIPYLPIGILMLVLYTFLPNLSNSDRSISTLTSLTLIPNGNPALSVAWSLSFELCFYILFSISFFSRRVWYYFLIIWSYFIITVNYFSLDSIRYSNNSFLTILFSVYNIEFILGYLLALLLFKKYVVNLKLILLVLSILIVCFFYCIAYQYSLFYFSINFLFVLISFIFIYLAVVYCTKKIKKTAIFMYIGNASYSIYLIHNPLQMIIVRFIPKINTFLSATFALIFVLIIASSIGYLYYLLFEKRAILRIKKMLVY
jgi:peptidoglycan/LPS O-acetylase OafA/YrhL